MCGSRRGAHVMASILVNRAPVLTLWAAVVAERLGHPADTALTLGRAVAGSAARVKARHIGREKRKADRDAETPRLAVARVAARRFCLEKQSGCCPTKTASCAPPTVTGRAIPPRLSAISSRRSAPAWP